MFIHRSRVVVETLMAVTCFSATECWSSKGQKRSVDTPRSKVQYMKLISKLSLASQDVQKWTGNIRIPENSQSSEMRASAVAVAHGLGDPHGWELWTGLARKCQKLPNTSYPLLSLPRERLLDEIDVRSILAVSDSQANLVTEGTRATNSHSHGTNLVLLLHA
jgi:hypothetical protein